MKRFMILMLLPAAVQADNVCRLQERTVNRTQAVIQERSPIEKVVVPYMRSNKKCITTFQVRINNQWHAARGEHVWSGDRPENEACAIAADRAETDVKFRVGKSYSATERVLECKDPDSASDRIKVSVGNVGGLAQFRPHPKYTESFHYNGTQCRWFVDPEFNGSTVRTSQGIICELRDSKWVVVDKF